MVLADSHKIPRVPWYLGVEFGSPVPFAYGTITRYGPTFQNGLARSWVCNFRPVLCHRNTRSHNPDYATHTGLHVIGLGLLPFARRYLGDRMLLSFPRATEMFQLAPLAAHRYVFTMR